MTMARSEAHEPPAAGRFCCTLTLAALAALGGAPAFSQQARVAQAGQGPIEELVVTARKTEENVQDIPMSVQVLDAEFLDTADRTHLLDLQYAVPGLVVNNLGLNGAGFSLRAIGDQGGSSLSVATHFNGVYLGAPSIATARMFDLQRVEVLKGPQGTLYGRNATGGSINSISNAPGYQAGAGIEAAYGSFGTTRAEGHVDIPFDASGLRLAFIASEGDGFIRNSADRRRFGENDFWGARAAVRLDASDELRIDIAAQRIEDDGARGELWLPRPDFLVDPSDIRLASVTLANPFLETTSDIVTVNVEYDFGPAVLQSVTGYAANTLRNVDDCAGLPILSGCVRSVLPARHAQLSQEIRFVSRAEGPVEWLVGASYYDHDASRNYFQLTPVIDPAPTINGVTDSDETTIAAFGQAIWRVSNQWSLTVGARLNSERHGLSTSGSGVEDSPVTVSASDSMENDSWRLDVQYAVTDEVLAYAGVSTGFKSGGFTVLPGGVLDRFGPEQLTAYEAGIKSTWLDRRLRLNGSAFLYDFRDLQVSTSTITDDGFIFETDNAAVAEIYGVDAEVDFLAGDRWSVSGGLVWLPKREFVSYRNDRTGDTLSGNVLTRAPEWSATAALEYDQPIRAGGRLSVRLEYAYRSSHFYTTDNDPLFGQDGFGLFNALLRFTPSDADWSVFAAGRNIGNADYFDQVFLQSSPGYPDHYEVGFGYRF